LKGPNTNAAPAQEQTPDLTGSSDAKGRVYRATCTLKIQYCEKYRKAEAVLD
jgi:hypothetical protein